MKLAERVTEYPRGGRLMVKKRHLGQPRLFEPNVKAVKKTLEKLDFLSRQQDNEKLRRDNYFVVISGIKGAGKSTFAKYAYASLQREGYDVTACRASQDSDPQYTETRRRYLTNEETKWYDVVNALRAEAASALERRVLKDLRDGGRTNKRGVVLLTRATVPDTLIKQYLRGIPPEAVAHQLRGDENAPPGYAPPGYINQDLTLIFTCDGQEALERIIRERKDSAESRGEELVSSLGKNFPDRMKREIEAYKKIAGYSTGGLTNIKKQAFNGETRFIDTSTDLDYNAEGIFAELDRRITETTEKIVQEIIIPKLKK